MPLAWPFAALIGATLFLNFPFWFERGLYLWTPGSFPRYAVVVAGSTLLIAALFFVGPALAAHAARRPLFDVVESSFGSIPAWGVRLCCIWFLAVWIGDLVSWPASRFVTFILRRNSSVFESAAIATSLVALLLITGLQSFRIGAKQALFTDKLGLAILLAALIRVHQGVPTALKGFPTFSDNSVLSIAWHGLSLLASFVGPLIFLLADFGQSLQTRKAVAMVAGIGVVLPLFGTLLLVGVIGAATLASRYYQPSLDPNVAMALWSKAAPRALPGLMMISSITMFGAGRFGVKALWNWLTPREFGRRIAIVPLGCILGTIVWCSVHPFNEKAAISLQASSQCLAVAAAVLTADFVSGRRRFERAPRIDWIALIALIVGLATALCVQLWTVDAWWEPGLLPSYGVGFIACLLGRALQKKSSNLFNSLSAS